MIFALLYGYGRYAIEMRVRLMKQMAQGLIEYIKNEDPLAWIGRMNNIKACADEIILNEIVFA